MINRVSPIVMTLKEERSRSVIQDTYSKIVVVSLKIMVIGKSYILCLLGLCGTFFVFAGKLCDDNDRRCGRVVRDARVVSSNPGLRQLAIGKLCQPSSKWIPFFETEKDKAAKGKEWVPTCLCCAQDTVGL